MARGVRMRGAAQWQRHPALPVSARQLQALLGAAAPPNRSGQTTTEMRVSKNEERRIDRPNHERINKNFAGTRWRTVARQGSRQTKTPVNHQKHGEASDCRESCRCVAAYDSGPTSTMHQPEEPVTHSSTERQCWEEDNECEDYRDEPVHDS